MARHAEGRVVYFSMATQAGEDGWDRVDNHCGRGGAAFVLQETDEGELVTLRLGPRMMPLLYTHLIPATFGGRARMNVANALAAAAAAWAAGAHLHDIRQGLRTFTTSFFQAPGRLNYVEVNGVRAIIDYCHNVDGMRNLADFVNRLMADGSGGLRTRRAIGVIGMPGDRRDEDMRAYGALAATAFDEVIVREDKNLRGRAPGETAALVVSGIRADRAASNGHAVAGSGNGHATAASGTGHVRASKVDKILDEAAAVRTALRRANPGDLVVMCVDDAIGVYRETMALAGGGDSTATAFADPGELEVPAG
jgi:cyanophycin synthetase